MISAFFPIDTASKLIIQHPFNSSYNQGWGWSLTTVQTDLMSTDTPFVSQSIGRLIYPPDPITQVFSGAFPTTDVIFMTPFDFSSDVYPDQNFRAVVLNVTKNPQQGTTENATDVFLTQTGTFFELNFYLNGYTKHIRESHSKTPIDLIVTITSVFGVISLVSSFKVNFENVKRRMRERRRMKTLNRDEDEGSSSSLMGSSISLESEEDFD